MHAVLYTHEHADHIFGLDDLRLMQFYLGGPVPLYCEAPVEERIRKSYDYAFCRRRQTHPGAVPQLAFRRIGLEPFEVLGAQVTPIRLKHGQRFDVLGFRFGNVAYCTDANAIPPESMELLAGLDVLVLDALRPTRPRDALQPGRGDRSRPRARAAADVLHAHVARAGARGDERGAAGRDGAGYDGLRIDADVDKRSAAAQAAPAASLGALRA